MIQRLPSTAADRAWERLESLLKFFVVLSSLPFLVIGGMAGMVVEASQ